MTFSIIVVVSRGVENKDRRVVFNSCFRALCSQDFTKGDYEVVVVDSGSGLTQRDVLDISQIAADSHTLFTYLNPGLGNIGPAKARNIGIKAVSGGQTKLKSQATAFTDDDTLVPVDWLGKLSEGFKNNPEALGVGGLTLPPKELVGRNIFAYHDQFIYNRYPKASGKSLDINEHPVFSGNLAYKRLALEQAGMFDESFEPWLYGEDADLKERMVDRGGFLVFVDTINTHLAEYSLRRFMKQQECRGAGILRFRKKHGLKITSKAGIFLRLLATPVALFYYFAKNRRDLKIVFLETLAYLFRQEGKLKYYNMIVGDGPTFKTKTRILFADHTPFTGGAQLALLRHLRYLDKTIFTPVAVVSRDCPDFNNQLQEIDGVRCHFLPFPRLKPINALSILNLLTTSLRLALIVFGEKSDVIVANTERAFYACFLASLLLNKKLVLIIRDFEYSQSLLNWTGFKVSRHICVSKKLRDFYSLNEKPCEIIYVGSDIGKRLLRVGREQVEEKRALIKAWEGYKIIGFVGRVISWKGVFLLLEAFAQVLPRERKVKLVFVGDGPDKERLIDTAKRIGVYPQVHFEGFTDEVEIWYKTFDAFVHASILPEPFATTVIEASFAHLPIVATNTGGTPEFIEDEKNGLLVEPEKESLAEALGKLVNDAALREELGEAAFQKASSGYTEEKITKEFERVYESV